MLVLLALWAAPATRALADYKRFPTGYCTYYAAQQFDSVAPSPGVDWHGDAGAWVENAHATGWYTSTDLSAATPRALVVWKGSTFGHVAWIDGKDNKGITISEMN